MTEPVLADEIEAFLAEHNVISLATCDAEGLPHAANLFFANDGLTLYWVSDPETRHSRHLGAGAQIAATIAPDCRDYAEIKGLQIKGRCRPVDDAQARAHGMQCLLRRYEFLKQFQDGPAALQEQFDKAVLYRLDPETITLIDNTKGFGFKQTLNL